MDYLVKSSLANINKIRDFIFTESGLPTKYGIILYTAYVRAKIETSYPAWSTINETELRRLDTVQGLAMKMILNIKGSTSYNGLDVEAGVLFESDSSKYSQTLVAS